MMIQGKFASLPIGFLEHLGPDVLFLHFTAFHL